jgi:hypothetical protein
MSRHTADVVIVGGGLIGVWTAFFLARRKQRVVLIEKGVVGAQSSGTNFGNLRLQGRFPGQYPLSLRSQALWEEIEALIGEDCEFAQTGHLYLAYDHEERAKLEGYAQVSESHGLAIERLGPSELRKRWPWLSERAVAATFSARDATANPRLVTPAVARAARALGVTIIENACVTDVAHSGEGFSVKTADGAHWSCGALVNAAGAWAVAIAERFGETAPIVPAGPPQFVTEPFPYLIEPSIQAIRRLGDLPADPARQHHPRGLSAHGGRSGQSSRARPSGQDIGRDACARQGCSDPGAMPRHPRLVRNRGLSARHDPGDRLEPGDAGPLPRLRLLRPWLPDRAGRRALPERDDRRRSDIDAARALLDRPVPRERRGQRKIPEGIRRLVTRP